LTFVLGIVNAGSLPVYDDIEPSLLKICEDILWNRNQDSTEQMLAYCQSHSSTASTTNAIKDVEWRGWSVEKRLEHSLVKVKIVKIENFEFLKKKLIFFELLENFGFFEILNFLEKFGFLKLIGQSFT
jgi:cobalamin-dependent methionine synthase I